MKKIIKVVPRILILIFSLFVFSSCENESEIEIEQQSVTARQLIEEESFRKIAKEMTDFSGLIINALTSQEIPRQEVISQIKKIENSRLSVEEQAKKLGKLLNIDFLENGVNTNVISKNLEILNSKYTGIEEQLLTETFELYFEKNSLELQSREGVGECGWRFYLCSAAAIAGGTICLGGCTVGTAGVGAPGCLYLCGIIQTFAIVQCSDLFCPLPF